ncbi:putative transposon, En/Spm-like protein, partial [Tanacetum coccineum]
MQAELVVTLCLLEKLFPLSFFDIMIHLTVHLTREDMCETIGIPTDKHETDENEEGKPLSAGKSSKVSAKLFQKAYLRHKQVLKTENPGKRIAFLENEHSKSFAKWLRKEVERELAISKESVSETVRWISYGPRATVVKYDAYNINGYTFRTKCHDGKVYQNSGVSVEAIDLHISKEVATTRQAFYYGVLQEIWVLDYRFRKIPLFKCDWINHRAGGVKRDNLGYTMVDLNNLGHKVDPFILASQARQVFYVKDHIDKKLSIVFKTPPKNYKDTYDEVDEEFSTVIHQRNDNILPCVNRRDLGNESRDDYYRTDCRVKHYQSFNWEDFLKTSQISTSEEIDYDSPEPPKSLLKWYHYLSDEYNTMAASEASSKAKVEACGSKAKVEACGSKSKLQATTKTLSADSSYDSKGVSSKGPSITSIPKEGTSITRLSKEPIPKKLLAWYGYDIVEDDLPVVEKPIPKVIIKSPIPIKRRVLGLANVETWDNIVKKYGMRTPGRCADKSKGKIK